MNWYHSWIYEHILNTKWFMWSFVITVFALNFLGPILIWFVMNSKKIPLVRKKQQSNEK
jgi:hypothetical protein